MPLQIIISPSSIFFLKKNGVLHQGNPQTINKFSHRSVSIVKLISLKQNKICARTPLMLSNMRMIERAAQLSDVVGLYGI